VGGGRAALPFPVAENDGFEVVQLADMDTEFSESNVECCMLSLFSVNLTSVSNSFF